MGLRLPWARPPSSRAVSVDSAGPQGDRQMPRLRGAPFSSGASGSSDPVTQLPPRRTLSLEVWAGLTRGRGASACALAGRSGTQTDCSPEGARPLSIWAGQTCDGPCPGGTCPRGGENCHPLSPSLHCERVHPSEGEFCGREPLAGGSPRQGAVPEAPPRVLTPFSPGRPTG